jgi:taurine dioxygenase
MKTTYGPISVDPVAGFLGAEVSGITIGPLDDEHLGHLHDAWMDWKVLFFRDQHVSTADHIAFGRQLGDLEIHPFLPNDGNPEIVVLDTANDGPSRAEAWHTDVSFRECPPMGSVLRGRIIPPVGGDTLWVDMARAYDALDDATKDTIEHLTATHTLRMSFGRRLSDDELEAKLAEFPDQHHPLVRVHPVTGRRSLFLSPPFLSHIDGVERDESRRLLDRLNRQTVQPTFQVRFRWRENSFAMWDNRCTQHCASQDFQGRRRMERVTLLGDRPVGPSPAHAAASAAV